MWHKKPSLFKLNINLGQFVNGNTTGFQPALERTANYSYVLRDHFLVPTLTEKTKSTPSTEALCQSLVRYLTQITVIGIWQDWQASRHLSWQHVYRRLPSQSTGTLTARFILSFSNFTDTCYRGDSRDHSDFEHVTESAATVTSIKQSAQLCNGTVP